MFNTYSLPVDRGHSYSKQVLLYITCRKKHRDELKRSPPDISNLYEIPNERSLEPNGQYDTATPVYEVTEQLYENA